MSAKSLLNKKNIKPPEPETTTGLMEELNLPPQIISFVRENARTLQIGLMTVVVIVLGWILFDNYTESQENKGAAQLASAMEAGSAEEKAAMLAAVVDDYSRTGAGNWARLELAHIDYQDGEFAAAAAKYEEVVDRLSSDSSMLPLARMNLAQAYEETGQYDKAVAQYELVKKSVGFNVQAALALGRIYTANNENEKARSEYEGLLSTLGEEADPQLVSRLQAKLELLGAGTDAAPTQPEESK